jgi:hypothetical protein
MTAVALNIINGKWLHEKKNWWGIVYYKKKKKQNESPKSEPDREAVWTSSFLSETTGSFSSSSFTPSS